MEKEDAFLKRITDCAKALWEGRDDEALELSKICFEENPGSKTALKLLLYSAKRKYSGEKLYEFLKEIKEKAADKNRILILAELAEVSYEIKKYEECIKICEEFLSYKIPSLEILSCAVRASFNLNLPERAVQMMENFVEFFTEPENSYILFSAALFSLLYLKEVERAKKFLENISLKTPSFYVMKKVLGILTDEIEMVLEAIDGIIDSVKEDEIKFFLFLQKAWLLMERDKEKAISSLNNALSIKPDSLTPYLLLEEIARGKGDTELLREVLNKERKLLPPEDRIYVLEKLEEIYSLSGEYEKEKEVLEELFSISPKKDVADRLINLYTKTGEYEKAGDLYLSLSERGTREEMLSHLINASVMFEKAGEYQKCKLSLKKILEIEPSEPFALSKLPDVLAVLREWDELIEVYKKRIESAYDPKDIIMLSMKIGEVYEFEKGDLEKASSSYEKVLELAPAYLPALESMKRVDKKRGEWKRVISVNYRLIEMSSEQTTIMGLHWENGTIYLNYMGDTKKAREEFKKVLSIVPDYLPAIEMIKYISWAEGDLEEAISFLEKEIEITEMEKADELFFEGAILLNKAGKKDKFIKFLKRFLDKEDYRKRAIFRIMEEATDERERLKCLETLSEISKDDELSAFLLMKCGQIHRSLKDELNAKRCFVRAKEKIKKSYISDIEIEKDAIKNFHFDTLPDIYPPLNDFYGFLKEEGKAEKMDEYVLYSTILRREPGEELARSIWEFNLPERSRVEILWRFLSVFNQKEREKLLKNSIDFFEGSPVDERRIEEEVINLKDWNLYRELISKKTDLGGVEEEECLIAAELERMLGNYEKAIWWLDFFIGMHPEALYPRYLKAEFLKSSQRWAEYVQELKTIANKEEIERKESTLKECAEVLEKHLSDLNGAMEIYSELNSLFPGKREYLEELKRLSKTLGRYELLDAAFRRFVSTISEPEKASHVLMELGRIYEEIKEKKKAIEIYKEAYKIYPDLLPLLEIERILEEEGNFVEMVEVLKSQLDYLKGEEKAKKLHKMGKVFVEKLNEIEKAHESFSSAFEINPADAEIAVDLLQLRLRMKNLYGLKEVLDKSLKIIPPDKKTLLFECGKLFYDEGKNEWARDIFNVLREMDKENLELMNFLYDLHKRLSEWELSIEIGTEIVERLKKTDRKKSVSLLVELGEISRDKTKNEERAVEFFKNALSIDPSFLKARESLAELLIKLKREKEAFEESKKVLVTHPVNTNLLHFLAHYYEKNNLSDRAFCIVNILNFLGEMDNKVEKIIFEVSKEKAAKFPSGSIQNSDREKLFHPYEISELRNFFSVAGEYFISIAGIDSLALGTSKDALISPKSGHTFLKTIEEVSHFMGLKEIQLYISPLKSDAILSPSPNCLVIGSKVVRLLNAETLKFVSVKMLELSTRGYPFIKVIPDENAYSIFLGFIMLANPAFKHKDALDPKLISKALPLFKRSSIIKKVGEVLGELKEVPDLKAFKKHLLGVKMSAGRVALIACPDLESAVRGEAILLNQEFPQTPDGIKDFVEKHETALDLLRFYSSEPYFLLREKFGLSVV